MENVTEKTYRAVAFSYALLGVGFVIITGFTISMLGWHGSDQLLKDMKMFYASLIPIVVFALFNFVMSASCWRFLGLSKYRKRATFAGSIFLVLLPAFSLAWSLSGGSYQPNQIISILLIINYSLLAFCLARGMNSCEKSEPVKTLSGRS